MQKEDAADKPIEEITRLVESRNADAGPLLEQALARWPDNLKLCLLSADWHQQNGREEQAIKGLAAAFAAYPEKQALGMRLLMLHYDRGDLDNAGLVLAELQKRFKRSSKLSQWAARLALRRGEPQRVREHLEKALEHATNAEAGAEVLQAAMRLGIDGQNNWNLARKALTQWPESSELLVVAATAAVTAADDKGAADFLRQLELNNRAGSDWRATLGQALLELGQFRQACEVLQPNGDTSDFSLPRLCTSIEAAMRAGDRATACTVAEQVLRHPDAESPEKRIAINAIVELREYDRALAILDELPKEDAFLADMMARRIKVISRLPIDNDAAAALDDERKEVQSRFVEGADTTLLVFTGLDHRTAVPLSAIHTLLARFGVSVVYLRDSQRLSGMNGFQSLSGSYPGTVAALKRMLPPATTRVLCFGLSAGGYAALRYGLDLGAEKVLCMGAPTDASPAAAQLDGRARAATRRLYRVAPAMAQDMRAVYAASNKRPRVELWYGAEMPQDRMHAEHMRGLKDVTINAIPRCEGHGVLWQLISDERADAVFEAFLRR